MTQKKLIDKLYSNKNLSFDEFVYLIESADEDSLEYISSLAREISKKNFGNKIYIRGLIEISNICKNDCYYCGIRAGNKNVQRYKLTQDEILQCCEEGYKLGFRTFVMQGGEGGGISDNELTEIIKSVSQKFSDCAITLSVGEKEKEVYQRFFDAGASRFLLRHETADDAHYSKLHPKNLSLKTRKECLWNLKEIGFQVGTGFMVGSPFQTAQTLAKDLFFINELNPHMVGIGPFLPHKDTKFAEYEKGSMQRTLFLISVIRLMLPNCLIPSTTALGTISPNGREKGILAGANVVMPNLSPVDVRKKYMLYNDKISTDEESAEGLEKLKDSMERIGYRIITDRGDYKCIM